MTPGGPETGIFYDRPDPDLIHALGRTFIPGYDKRVARVAGYGLRVARRYAIVECRIQGSQGSLRL